MKRIKEEWVGFLPFERGWKRVIRNTELYENYMKALVSFTYLK